MNKIWLWLFCHFPRVICWLEGHTPDHTYGGTPQRCLVCGRKR